MRNDCKALFMNIHKLEFALIEMMLYLDTHPEDSRALAEYDKLQRAYNESVEAYTKMYAPISFNQVYSENIFSWALTPMPWEMEVYA